MSVLATILATDMHAVYLSFYTVNGSQEIAEFCPGRMFVNASVNLLAATRSRTVLRNVLREGMVVKVEVQPLMEARDLVFVDRCEERKAVVTTASEENWRNSMERKVGRVHSRQSGMINKFNAG